MPLVDTRLLEWATDRQKEAIEAINACDGSMLKAAAQLGIGVRRLRRLVFRAREKAATAGYAPNHDMTKTVPPGFRVKGVSTLYDAEGSVKGQWVKSTANAEDRLQLLIEAVADIAEPFRGTVEPTRGPPVPNSRLLAVYPMGDPHLGLMAWAPEVGTDFDLTIAERNLVTATDMLVSLAPEGAEALILNLGDFYHADNTLSRTLRSGHVLDVDTRWQKLLGVGVRAMRRCIDRALERHSFVTVRNMIGNHDDHSAIFLSLCLDALYEKEPRVRIDTSPNPFFYHRHGLCLIGSTHGDMTKPGDLPGIMATDRAKDWGDTKFRHWYQGHVHTDRACEFHGCTWESLRTLAARDAWTHRSGYRSGRDMKMDVWCERRGRILRHTIEVEAVEQAA